MTVEKPVNPRQWREVLASNLGSSWTFGAETIKPYGNPEKLNIVQQGRLSGTENAYYSAPMSELQAEELAGKLIDLGIEPILAESQGGNKCRVVVFEKDLRAKADAILALSETEHKR